MPWRISLQRLWGVAGPWLSVVLLVALIVVPVGLFIWLVFSTDLFRVEAVTVLDGRDHTIAAVEGIIEEELARVPLERTIFLVQTDVLEGRVLSALPQVRVVRVERKLPATLKVVLQEKTPALLLLSKGTYYFIDEKGVPYEEAQLHTLPGVVLPTVKNADTEADVKLGVPVVPIEFVSFVQYVEENVGESIGAKVAEIRIPSLAAREVHFILDTNWVVKFDVTRDPASQLNILSRIVKEMLVEEERTTLQYIDLRIPNRVYYK